MSGWTAAGGRWFGVGCWIVTGGAAGSVGGLGSSKWITGSRLRTVATRGRSTTCRRFAADATSRKPQPRTGPAVTLHLKLKPGVIWYPNFNSVTYLKESFGVIIAV